MRCVVGVDLGGTNVRSAVVSSEGEVLTSVVSLPSCAEEGSARTVSAIIDCVRSCIAGFSGVVNAVGLAVPGHVNDQAGLVHWSPNFGVRQGDVLHYWKDVDLRGPMVESLGLDVRLANDANAAALGEYLFGCGEGSAKCLVMLTMGTGIGGGVVLGPASVGGSASGPLLLIGGNSGGAELGHMVVDRGGLDSSAGTYGTVEAYCQRDAIVKRAQYKLIRGRSSMMSELVSGNLGDITPETIARAAEKGDAVAQEVWSEVGGYLGTAIGSLINVFAPDVFVLGGQVSLAGKWLVEPAISEARNVAIPSLFSDCKIMGAKNLAEAGVLGAAAVAFGASS